MNKNWLLTSAAVLLLLALVFIVIGLQDDSAWLWGGGMVAILLAMILSLATRWFESEEE